MISRPCRLLFLAVALAAGFFNSSYAQDTVPKVSQPAAECDLYYYNPNASDKRIIPRDGAQAKCTELQLQRWYAVYSDNTFSPNGWIQVGSSGDFFTQSLTRTTSTGQVISNAFNASLGYFGNLLACPETHPIDNGDGTCSMTEEDATCQNWADKHGTPQMEGGLPTGQIYDFSVFGIFTPNKNGEVCKAHWPGLTDDDPEQIFCSYKLSGDGISLGNGEFSGRYVPSGASCNPAPESSEPPLDEPETDEECEERGYAVCAVDGQFLVSSSLIDGFCFHECSSSQPTPEPPPVSDVDTDNNGIPDVNDPAHPDYDPDDPHSDPDNDGTPNYLDPTHPTYIGGGGTVANTEGTNVLLRQILDSQVVNNDLSITTNQLIAQQTQALGEKLDKLSSGVGGVVGGGDDGLWTDESATLEIETPDCTPDPVTGRCAEFGKLGVESLPEKTLDVSSYADDFTPIDTAATCPQEMPLTLGLGTFSFNTGPLCDVLSGIYYLVMFSAYYAVARIITRGATS